MVYKFKMIKKLLEELSVVYRNGNKIGWMVLYLEI